MPLTLTLPLTQPLTPTLTLTLPLRFYGETCLLDQTYLIEDAGTVSKVLEQASKDLGAPVSLTAMLR